jgi:hypothetical protein
MEMQQKKIFFLKKKKSKWATQKSEFFKIANFQKIFVKILRIGPWVCRIDWWEGHWCGACLSFLEKKSTNSVHRGEVPKSPHLLGLMYHDIQKSIFHHIFSNMGQEGFFRNFTFEKIPDYSENSPSDGGKLVILLHNST